MKAMHELKEMLCRELEEITRKGELTAGGLETAHKLTDTIKNIDKIMMLEDEGDGYSERGYSRNGYAQDGGYSRKGGYSRDGGYDERGSSYRSRRGTHYVRGHYSRDDGKDHMMRELGEMMEGADGEQRRILERAMREIRNA